jgi:hypothetical protein
MSTPLSILREADDRAGHGSDRIVWIHLCGDLSDSLRGEPSPVLCRFQGFIAAEGAAIVIRQLTYLKNPAFIHGRIWGKNVYTVV